MKKYRLVWIDDDANVIELGEYETNDPKRVLFNNVCKMICTASFFYDPKNPDNIMEAIKEGKKSKILNIEHYFYEANDHCLSIMEVR